jgi:hypothetical protein
MTYVTAADYERRPNWFRRAENWLDDKGKGAWIAAWSSASSSSGRSASPFSPT